MDIKHIRTFLGARRAVTTDNQILTTPTHARRQAATPQGQGVSSPDPPIWHATQEEEKAGGVPPLIRPSRCDQIPDGLVSCYTLDGHVLDGSGNGQDGSIVGDGVLPTTDRYGLPRRAYEFHGGSSDYIEIPHPGYLDDGTITAWFMLTGDGGSQDIVQFEGVTGGGLSMEAFIGTADISFGIYDGGWKVAYSGVYPELDVWYYTVGTWGAGGVKIYVNSQLKDTFAYYGGVPLYTIKTFIGAHPTYNRSIEGVIDSVRIYNRALSLAEIKQLEPW